VVVKKKTKLGRGSPCITLGATLDVYLRAARASLVGPSTLRTAAGSSTWMLK